MYLVNRGLSPAFQLAALTVLCAVARGCGGLIGEDVQITIAQLASVGTATLSSGDRRCQEAFWKLLGHNVSIVEWKIATVFASHLDPSDTNYASVMGSISEMGWTVEDIREMAGSGPYPGSEVAQLPSQPRPPSNGRDIAEQEEVEYFARKTLADVEATACEPTLDRG